MYEMRRMEIALDVLYKSKLVRGFCHLYDGQEAVAAGIDAVLTHKDSIITSYRDHCHHLIRGGTVKEVIGELMGKECGASHGMGGSMHMYKKETNWYGGCGIVGAQIPLGAGLAFKHKYSGERNIAITLFGDGAANQGQGYEAFNLAAIWSLPIIFIIENNQYGMGTASARASKSPMFYKRGDYIPGIKVDGMDVLAVREAIRHAKEYVLDNGPIVLEMDTYRYHGHSMSDPGSTYRTRDEVSSTRQERDPIERVKKLALEKGVVDAAEFKKVEKDTKKMLDGIIEECKRHNTPGMEYMAKFAYVDPKPFGPSVRGVYSGKTHDFKSA